MSVDLNSPARGMCDVLNPGGTFGTNHLRTGGTFVGSLESVQTFLPSVPYQGSTPFVLVSSVPSLTEINFDGAGQNRMDGELSLVYLARTPLEQNMTLSAVDYNMSQDLNAIVNAILADRHLADTVTSVTEPLVIERDIEGLFREWQGTMWSYAIIRVPFIVLPQP